LNLPGRSSTVILREVPEGAILFSTETEVYFSLNPIGVRVWRLLSPDCTSMDEVVARLHDEYPDVPPETIASDVRALLADLGSHGLIDPRGSS
jgi:hypothetical protein